MRVVEDEVFYHIQRKVFYNTEPFWSVGESLVIGEGKNPLALVRENHGANSGKAIGDMEGAISHYQNIIRELVFEKVRKEQFSDLPSRQKCLYVMPEDYETINYWWNRLPAEEKGDRVLFKLKLTGKIFKANQQFVCTTYESVSRIKELSVLYWSGTPGVRDIEDEYLFVGNVVVEEIIDLRESQN